MRANSRIVALYFALCFSVVLGAWAAPRGDFVLVVTNPLGSAADTVRTIADADGSIVASGRFGWIAVAYSDQPDFPSRLMRAGALAVLNNALAVGCIRNENGIF